MQDIDPRDYENVDITAQQVIDTRVVFVNVHNVFVDLGAATYDFIDSHHFTLNQAFVNGTYTFQFEGNHFSDAFGVPTGGTITKMTVLFNGVQQYTLTDISITVKDAYEFFQTKAVKLLPLMMHGKNTVQGSVHDDYIQTFAGNDKLFGNDGTDTMFGGAGNDKMHGGAGTNFLYGGGGKDKFFIEAPLVPGNYSALLDFKAKDRIVLDPDIFTGIPVVKGHVAGSAFSDVDDRATNTSNHIIIDKSNGICWVVTNGTAVQWGEVPDGTTVKAEYLIM